MSWLLLEEHHNFVSAWQLINDIAQVSCVSLSHAAHLLTRLNESDPIDGGYLIPFYGYRKFDGYFLASEGEIDLCIEALKKAILSETVSVFDGEKNFDIPLEDGFKAQKGMDFFFRKQDVLKAIEYKSMEMGIKIPLPSCIITTQTINPPTQKPSKKTENAQARFIKNLLTIMYGEEVSASPRRYIEGKDPQIKIDMDAKSLDCPSGITVEKWLSDID
ncbi:hypothetical protein OFY73_004272 [Salmonella enterica]|nr:hypothetical protein [Salmonella enterica]ECH9343598.1 hypothetical protein [Salmonella enterica subsp. enterica]EDQ6232038.1 hypothetical protein [Salmonella enterica subsp. enterica serovar Tucson]EGF6397520.1 hypothetical protein [Salmonella enterica subsp. enterica serovar Rottnest]EAX6623913.1 hypothetical protein [Salmonella enterica]